MKLIVGLCALLGLTLAARDTSKHHQTRKVVKKIDENNPNLWKKWQFPMKQCGDGSHYTVVHANSGAIKYADAWSSCKLAGGRLAHFESEAKYAEVKSYIQSNPFINQHCAASCQLDDNSCVYWVGAKAFGTKEDQWQWVEDAAATSGYPIIDGWPTFPTYRMENEGEHGVFMFLNPDYSVDYATYSPYKFGDYDDLTGEACGYICELNGAALSTSGPGHNVTVAPPTTTPKPETCQHGGVVQCYCDPGWTGTHCQTPINWCDQKIGGFSNCGSDPTCSGMSVTYSEACQPHGQCKYDNDGAYCVCEKGYWGPFCERPHSPNHWDIRRCSYEGMKEAYYDDGTPLPARDLMCSPGQWCVPDDLNCFNPMEQCPNYVGWCVPSQPDHTVVDGFKKEMAAMFKAEFMVKSA